MDLDIKKLEKIIGVKVTDKDLFLKAFTHRSYLNENKGLEIRSNERLEFLGDAVLQFLSSEFLFNNYQTNPEGDLTAFRASIVNTASLGEESKKLGYGEFLLLSKGEEANGGRENEYILANTFEAVLGAIYLNSDIATCRKFLEKSLFYKVKGIVESGSYRDSKSLFQEIAQEKLGITPTYKVIKEWGPDHDKNFEVAAYLEKKLIATGIGASKQKAESAAAKEGIDRLE